MDEVKKMLRTVINGQSSMKSELLTEIKKVDGKVDNLGKETKDGFKKINKRLDIIGKSVAYLEDDAPTIKEFDKLEKRVTKLETRFVKN